MAKEEVYKLVPTISISEKDFRKKISNEDWEKIKNKTFRDNNHKCSSCLFEPFDIHIDLVLNIHLVEENEEQLLNSIFRTTCLFCHMIEHADVAIEKGYLQLVNTHFSQIELVNICRNNAVSSYIEDGSIRVLKKNILEFLDELKSGKSKEGKVKVIFTKKFFDDLKVT